MTLPLHDYAALTPTELGFLANAFCGFTTLGQVLDWGRGVEPPLVVDEIITQDEYTHDVLLRLPDGRYLNFDAT